MKSELTRHSMMLINSLLAHVNDTRWEEFIGELDRLNVRKAVVVRCSHHHTTIHKLANAQNRLTAVNVLTYDRRPNILHPRFPSKHHPRNIP